MGSICVGIFAQTPLFTFWSLLFLEKSGSAVRPLCWESWNDSILCDSIHCCYFHYCIWVPDLKNRVTVFSSVKWKHKCVAEFLWELQRWCPDCCLVPWTVTGVSIGDPTQQSYSWRVSLALFFVFFFHQTVMATSQGFSAMVRFLQQEEGEGKNEQSAGSADQE